MSGKHWIPLESNPEVLTKFGHALGISPLLSFSDVWGLDLLDMVPAPRYAVLLLFPLTEKIESAAASIADEEYETDATKQPFFCKQTIGNACGTIALLHAAINSAKPEVPLVEGSFFDSFKRRTASMTGDERAAALQDDDGLEAVHGQFAQVGRRKHCLRPELLTDRFLFFTCCTGGSNSCSSSA